jgi:NAD(P)-dependent dehydrogenase (short-subunit alcohol dehydrogenase family)
MGLEGRVAVVTGSGSGTGEASCLRSAADGARVAVLGVEATAILIYRNFRPSFLVDEATFRYFSDLTSAQMVPNPNP